MNLSLITSGCLDLLPPEELEHLDIPKGMDAKSPIKELVYVSEPERMDKERMSNLSVDYLGGARFNLFTGNQSLEQREQQFKVPSLSGLIMVQCITYFCTFCQHI